MSTKFRTYIRCENLITHVDLDISVNYPYRPMEVPFDFEEDRKFITKYASLDVHGAIAIEMKKRIIEHDTGIFRGQRVFVNVSNGKSWGSGEFELIELGGRVADIRICRETSEHEAEEMGKWRNFLIKFDNPHQKGLTMKAVYAKLKDFDERGNVIFGPHLCPMRRGSFYLVR